MLALKGIELSNPLMALVVAVLSKSITPTGMSVGTPLCISEVKKVDNDYETAPCRTNRSDSLMMMPHSRTAILYIFWVCAFIFLSDS